MAANPDTLPDSADPSGPCPRCGRASNFRRLGSIPVTFGDTLVQTREGAMHRAEVERVSVLACLGCQQGVAVVEEEWIGNVPRRAADRTVGGTLTWRGIHWWPNPGSRNLSNDIPVAVRDAFAEGARCLSAGAEHGAVVMFRRTLEAIIDDRGNEAAKKQRVANDLAGALLHMSKAGLLDASLATWATEIRLAGNTGGHFDPLQDLAPGEAEDLSRLCRSLLEYLYEMPARIKRARGGSPATST